MKNIILVMALCIVNAQHSSNTSQPSSNSSTMLQWAKGPVLTGLTAWMLASITWGMQKMIFDDQTREKLLAEDANKPWDDVLMISHKCLGLINAGLVTAPIVFPQMNKIAMAGCLTVSGFCWYTQAYYVCWRLKKKHVVLEGELKKWIPLDWFCCQSRMDHPIDVNTINSALCVGCHEYFNNIESKKEPTTCMYVNDKLYDFGLLYRMACCSAFMCDSCLNASAKQAYKCSLCQDVAVRFIPITLRPVVQDAQGKRTFIMPYATDVEVERKDGMLVCINPVEQTIQTDEVDINNFASAKPYVLFSKYWHKTTTSN